MADPAATHNVLTARQAGLVACRECGQVHQPGRPFCTLCQSPLSSRDTASLQRVWAWLFAGMVIYIPANVYPMLLTATFGHQTESTILGGVIELWAHHNYGIAAIVFIASIMIPIGKFMAIGYLAWSVSRPVNLPAHSRVHLYEIVEFIGRWSMIDVFVVAILSALVQLDFVATINPGIAAVSFALSVAFTMISAQSFDPRLIWDAETGRTV